MAGEPTGAPAGKGRHVAAGHSRGPAVPTDVKHQLSRRTGSPVQRHRVIDHTSVDIRMSERFCWGKARL